MSGNILVVDDEKIVRDFFLDVARSLGGNVETAEDGDVAVEKCRSNHYDMVFLDMRMPHMNGLDACRTILTLDPQVKVVMMSGYSEDRIERIVHLVKIHDYPEKINEKDEILLMEADRLDRLGKNGIQRVQAMFSKYGWKRTLEIIDDQSKNWFRTKTGIETCQKLLEEMKKELRVQETDR